LTTPGTINLEIKKAQHLMRMKTRNKGVVIACCDPIEWVVAVKNKDDPPGELRNLRKISFVNPDADSVYVVNPVLVADGKDARGQRVNGYSDTNDTAFRFLEKVPLPADLYIEGLRRSSGKNDIGFEFQFFKGETALCGGGALGTVVALDATFQIPEGNGAPFKDHQKMLVKAKGTAKAKLKPRLNVDKEWSYRDETAPFAKPTEWKSSFLAPNQVSADRDDEVVFEINPRAAKLRGQIIEAFIEAICTAPTTVQLDAPFQGPPPTVLYQPRKKFVLDLFNFRIVYEMLDQFGDGIKAESAWGGCTPVCRENIGSVLRSPLPRVHAHIQQNLKHTPNWKVKRDGTINDRIKVKKLSIKVITEVVAGQRRFLAPLLVPITPTAPVLMDLGPGGTHIWFVGVKRRHVYDGSAREEEFRTGQGAGFPQVTANTFSARVVDRHPVGAGANPRIDLSFQGFYTVVLT
jgi:hypothetical protein